MRIVCISDTHTLHHKFDIPEGDMLIHAGDFSSRGKEKEIIDFDNWLGKQPHKHKIVIAGNHDFLFENEPALAQSLLKNAIYLENSGIEIEGIKIWGSPITPYFFNWAFNRQRGDDIKRYWDIIPEDTEILITHGPPFGLLDCTVHGLQVGCVQLLERIQQIQPKLHIFGHIHEAYGTLPDQNTTFINASLVDVSYQPVNVPIVIDWS